MISDHAFQTESEAAAGREPSRVGRPCPCLACATRRRCVQEIASSGYAAGGAGLFLRGAVGRLGRLAMFGMRIDGVLGGGVRERHVSQDAWIMREKLSCGVTCYELLN